MPVDHEPCLDVDFDHHTEGWVEDPYRVYAGLRSRCPVAHSAAHGGFWLLSRYADVHAALLDHERFSSAHPGRVAIPHTSPGPVPGIPIEVDPPLHDVYRDVVAPFFTRAAVEWLSPIVEARSDELLDGVLAAERCELVGSFAAPLLATTLSSFFALPVGDVPRIEAWADAVFAKRLRDPAGAARANAELAAYLRERLAERRAAPGDDVVSAIATADVGGRPLSDDEALAFGRILLLAGREASIDALCTFAYHLARDAELEAAVRARAATATGLFFAIEEMLRFDAPIQLLGRVTTREVTVRGCTIPQGASVAMLYASANRDESTFDHADRFDPARDRVPHLSFGAGHHHCLGANLARLVLRIGVGRLLARTSDLGLVAADPPQRKPNGDARGFVQLPLQLVARGSPVRG